MTTRSWGSGAAAALAPTCAGEILEALRAGEPVVALESTIISHGLPRPYNLAVARELEALVAMGGARAATVAVIDGVARVGLSPGELERLSVGDGVRKLGLRDLPLAAATGATGATTVSATAHLAALAGIRVFATGGIGGVHRGFSRSFDESADLTALGRTRVTVVSAGVKSILDVAATLERLETLNVSVAGYRTWELPGFYLHSSGHRVDWRLDTPEQVALAMQAQDRLGIEGALLVANAVDPVAQLDPQLHDRVLLEALEAAEHEGVAGQQLTPFLLDRMVRLSGGAALEANVAAVKGNCALAAEVACAWSDLARTGAVPDGR